MYKDMNEVTTTQMDSNEGMIELQEFAKDKLRKQFFLERNYTSWKFYKPSSKHKKEVPPYFHVAEAVSKNKDETALLQAAMNNNYDKAKYLLAKNVNVDTYSGEEPMKATPFTIALQYGSVDVVALLLLHGLKFEAKTHQRDLEASYCKSFSKHFDEKNTILRKLVESSTIKDSCDKHLQQMEQEYKDFAAISSRKS